MVDYEDYGSVGGALSIGYKQKNEIVKKIQNIIKEHEGFSVKINTASDVFWKIVDELAIDKNVKMTKRQERSEDRRVENELKALEKMEAKKEKMEAKKEKMEANKEFKKQMKRKYKEDFNTELRKIQGTKKEKPMSESAEEKLFQHELRKVDKALRKEEKAKARAAKPAKKRLVSKLAKEVRNAKSPKALMALNEKIDKEMRETRQPKVKKIKMPKRNAKAERDDEKAYYEIFLSQHKKPKGMKVKDFKKDMEEKWVLFQNGDYTPPKLRAKRVKGPNRKRSDYQEFMSVAMKERPADVPSKQWFAQSVQKWKNSK